MSRTPQAVSWGGLRRGAHAARRVTMPGAAGVASMFRITRHQFDRFNATVREEFVHATTDRLWEWGVFAAGTTPEAALASVGAAIVTAIRGGVASQSALGMYAYLAVVFGPSFEVDEPFAANIRHARVTGDIDAAVVTTFFAATSRQSGAADR